MKIIFTLSIIIILSSCTNTTNNEEITKDTFEPPSSIEFKDCDDYVDIFIKEIDVQQDSNEIESIKKMLYTQQECWNNGDIYGFMEEYWNSEELIFTSSEHMPAYGWQNTLERYKNSYPTKESMGELKFDIYNVKLTSKRTAILNGKWELTRINDNPKGEFWLDIEKFDNNWLIVKDSTTSLY
mgnify:CR=1 FL=1